MDLKQLFLTKNACYLSGKKHTVRGIMVHSTGANNPNLKRYVGPDDGLLGVNEYGNHWNTMYPSGISVCVHAFIGKLKDGSIATYQTLPWDMVGWHSGNGSKGSAGSANNNGYIGFEICEDGLTDAAYFNKVYTEAVELCAYLCKLYGLKPESPTLICHSEGYKLGIASNHGDVMHWFPKHGKSMDTFRADVKAEINGGADVPVPADTLYRVRKSADDAASQIGAYTNLASAKSLADKNPGFEVYDRAGTLIYDPQGSGLPELTRLLELSEPMTRGEDVRSLQLALGEKGYPAGTADGMFGSRTQAAVKAFQSAFSLTVDGIVGPKTWAALGA